ncbi:hypothetical protein NKH18_48045 [Streptomyces sp. M10(2022)]
MGDAYKVVTPRGTPRPTRTAGACSTRPEASAPTSPRTRATSSTSPAGAPTASSTSKPCARTWYRAWPAPTRTSTAAGTRSPTSTRWCTSPTPGR